MAIDDTKGSPVEQVMAATKGQGADRGCECVGYQCHDPDGNEVPNETMNSLVHSVRPTGSIGVVGVFAPQDPLAHDELARTGKIAFDMGLFFQKGLSMGSGQCNVKAYNRTLCALIESGKSRPSFLISHRMDLSRAPEAYDHFDRRDTGWTKVVLKPGAIATSSRTSSASATADG